MNGLKIQWIRTPISVNVPISFPISFSNNDYILMAQTQSSTSSYANGFIGGDYNRQSDHRTFYTDNSYHSYTGYYQFIAIGY